MIPDDVRRFMLTSIVSVPHLEALLLFQRSPDIARSLSEVAAALYLPEAAVGGLLDALCAIGVLVASPGAVPQRFRYAPRGDDQRVLLERVSQSYSTDMIEMTRLIHDATQKSAQRFADAFRLRQDR